jgi:DNA-binding transcriptional regulator YiaG
LKHEIKGEEIRRIREQIGMSQAQLGEKLDVSQNTIARWEREDIKPEHPGMLILALEHLKMTHMSPELEKKLLERRARLMKNLGRE